MYAVAIAIQPGPAAAPCRIDAIAVADILWANALPQDRLEHIKSGAGPDSGPAGAGVDIVLFLHAEDLLTAGQCALAVCLRALGSSPELRNWDLVSLSTNILS